MPRGEAAEEPAAAAATNMLIADASTDLVESVDVVGKACALIALQVQVQPARTFEAGRRAFESAMMGHPSPPG